MRKLIFQNLLTLLSISTMGFALPLGNPAEPAMMDDHFSIFGCENFGVSVGYYGDFVFNRHAEIKEGTRVDGGSNVGEQIEYTQIFTNAGYLAFNFYNMFEVFGTLGATRLYIDTATDPFDTFVGIEIQRLEIEFDTSFSWSVGARATLIEWCNTFLGVEFQYFSSNPKLEYVSQYLHTRYPSDLHVHYQEWQIGLGISHQIGCLIPYAGVKWSKASFDDDQRVISSLPILSDTLQIFDFGNQRHWGGVIGATLFVSGYAQVTAEARFGDEKALYINGQICF